MPVAEHHGTLANRVNISEGDYSCVVTYQMYDPCRWAILRVAIAYETTCRVESTKSIESLVQIVFIVMSFIAYNHSASSYSPPLLFHSRRLGKGLFLDKYSEMIGTTYGFCSTPTNDLPSCRMYRPHEYVASSSLVLPSVTSRLGAMCAMTDPTVVGSLGSTSVVPACA